MTFKMMQFGKEAPMTQACRFRQTGLWAEEFKLQKKLVTRKTDRTDQ